MRYLYAERQVNTPYGNIVQGELITEREAAKSKKRDYINKHCRLVEWPARHTYFCAGARFRRPIGCVSISQYNEGWRGTELDFPSDDIGTHLGHLGAQSKSWWYTHYANCNACFLVEE